MKTYERHRSVKELRAELKKLKGTIDDSHYKTGGDHVRIVVTLNGIPLSFLFSAFNGRAFGTYGKRKTPFNTDSTEHDSKRCFQSLLRLIYTDAPRP